MATSSERRVVPIKEAIRRVGRKRWIHTFMGGGPSTLIGADHDRNDLIAAMREHGVEDSGDVATSMGHTLVIVDYPCGHGTTPLFIKAGPSEEPESAGAVARTDGRVTNGPRA